MPRQLKEATKIGNHHTIQALIQEGVDVNGCYKNLTPLMWAVEYRRPYIARLLIGAGADVNAQDRTDKTALLKAVEDKHLGLVRILLNAGADPNMADRQGCTPLMLSRSAKITRLLLHRSADINATDHQGNTALIWAASCPEDNSVAQILLDANADVAYKNTADETAYQRANQTNQTVKEAITRRASSELWKTIKKKEQRKNKRTPVCRCRSKYPQQRRRNTPYQSDHIEKYRSHPYAASQRRRSKRIRQRRPYPSHLRSSKRM